MDLAQSCLSAAKLADLPAVLPQPVLPQRSDPSETELKLEAVFSSSDGIDQAQNFFTTLLESPSHALSQALTSQITQRDFDAEGNYVGEGTYEDMDIDSSLDCGED